MPTLRLSALPAEVKNGMLRVTLNVGALSDIAPPKQVEIRTAADALKALDEYAATVTVPAYVSGSLARGDRAPSGFRKLKLGKTVNC